MKAMSKKVALNRNMTDEFFMERAMLAQVHHEFLCNAQHCFQDANFCYIILDLALGGDVKYHMKHPSKGLKAGCLSEALATFYFAQLALALAYLHDNDILHRDVKPENMIIAKDGYVKLTDFGVSQKMNKDGLFKGSSGTSGYMAPEIYSRAKLHGAPADWFAAGVTLHQMCLGSRPFSDNKPTRKSECRCVCVCGWGVGGGGGG